MTEIPEIEINLTQSPSQRWTLSPQLQEQAKQLLRMYLDDLGEVGLLDTITDYAELFVAPPYMEEIESLARLTQFSLAEALLVNLYYDALKVVLGCTAFAVDTPNGPLHARNLDWWTERASLSTCTTITRFSGGPHNHAIKTIGWPGFIGALSGVAPGRFAITLNAVLSNDPPALAKPISLFLRTVFEEVETYDQAVDVLMTEEIASDCLLLIRGIKAGEMVVIERTPTRAAMRQPENGYIAVANEYLTLNAENIEISGELQSTSRGRFETMMDMLVTKPPRTPEECLDMLSNPVIQMDITVQQMVFSARTGLLNARLPANITG